MVGRRDIMGWKLIAVWFASAALLTGCTVPLTTAAPPRLGASITTNWSQDLAGSTYSAQTVSGIQTHAVAAPTTAGALEWTGSAWVYSSGLPAGPCGADLAASGGNCGVVQSITPSGGTTTELPFNATGLKSAVSTFNVQDNGAVTRFSLETNHGRGTFGGGTDFLAIIGALAGAEASNSALYLLPNAIAPSTTNYAVDADGTNLFVNTRGATGYIQLIEGNASIMGQFSNTNFTIGGGGSFPTQQPLRFDWSTATTPFIQSGTSATSLTLSTNKAGAALVLQQDAAITAWTLNGGNALAMTAPATATSVTISQSAAAGAGATWTVQAQGSGGTNDGGPLQLLGGNHSGLSKADGSVHVISPFNGGVLVITPVNGTNNLTNAQSDNNDVFLQAGATNPITINFLREIADTSCVNIRNNTSQTATIAFISGGTATIVTGIWARICSDGANLQVLGKGT